MKKRKLKSKLTNVDLDAVLKLQRDHTNLECELLRLLQYVNELYGGDINADEHTLRFDNKNIYFTATTVTEMAVKCKQYTWQSPSIKPNVKKTVLVRVNDSEYPCLAEYCGDGVWEVEHGDVTRRTDITEDGVKVLAWLPIPKYEQTKTE